MEDIQLDKSLATLYEGLPSELKANVQEKIDWLKTKRPTVSNAEVYREAREWVRLEMLAYLDRRSYLSMYNRKWAEHILYDAILALVAKPEFTEHDLYTIARVNFDFNGLKALNDLGGHDAGNQGLRLFADMLKGGETTTWLRGQDIKVTPSAEGGDEFGLVLVGDTDLRKIVPEVHERYLTEVKKLPASNLINFAHPGVREKMFLLGVSEIPQDFKFEISASAGISILGEALAHVEIAEYGAIYEKMIQAIINKLIAMADMRSLAHKSAFKEELDKSNPILSALYSRMSKEVLHLQKEIHARDEKIRALEDKLRAV